MLCPEVAVEVERRALKLVIDADSELVSAGEGDDHVISFVSLR